MDGSPTTPPAAPRQNLSEHLSRLILDLIRGEHLRPGDRLPSVNALAARFGVATPTLREALRRLEATGVVEIRHGSGVYVRDRVARAVLVNPHLEQLDRSRFLELLDSRLLIEPRLAADTARRAQPEAVDHLQRLLDDALQHLDGEDDRALHGANGAFHAAIARASGNSILGDFVESLLDLYSFEQLVIIELYNDRARDHLEHRRILDAIRDTDPDLAERLMHEHLRAVRDIVRNSLEGG